MLCETGFYAGIRSFSSSLMYWMKFQYGGDDCGDGPDLRNLDNASYGWRFSSSESFLHLALLRGENLLDTVPFPETVWYRKEWCSKGTLRELIKAITVKLLWGVLLKDDWLGVIWSNIGGRPTSCRARDVTVALPQSYWSKDCGPLGSLRDPKQGSR